MSQKLGKRRQQQIARVASVNPWNSLDVLRDQLRAYERQIALDAADVLADGPARSHDGHDVLPSRIGDVLAHRAAGPSRQYMPWDGERRRLHREDLPQAYAMRPDPFFEECYLQAVNLSVNGVRVMHVGDGLCQQMAATENNAPSGDFKLPFNAFVLTTRSETMLRLFLEGTPASYSSDFSLSIVVSIGIDRHGSRRLSLFSHAIRGQKLVQSTVARINLEERTVRECVRSFLRLGLEQPTGLEMEGMDQASRPGNWFGEHGETYYLTLINVLLYLTTPRISMRETAVTAELDDESRETTRVVVAGEDEKPIVLDPSKIVRAVISGNGREPEFRIDSRIMVRGHWRARKGQAALPEPERQWIRPYWKGLDQPERPQRHYEVRMGDVR